MTPRTTEPHTLRHAAARRPACGPEDRPLTPREREVVAMIAQGHTSQEIATGLRISIRTVEGHRASIKQKLGLHKRSELVAYAHGVGGQVPPPGARRVGR